MDKQKLAKHHFWFLLPLVIILSLVVVGGASFGVGKAAREAQAKIDAKNGALNKAAPKTQEYIQKLDQQKGKVGDRRNVVWQKAYEDQAGLIVWPDALSHLNSLYFGDPIAVESLNKLEQEDVYLAEYRKLGKIIEPTKFANTFRVDDLPTSVMRIVHFAKHPSVEDAWLAIEDLCVQREVLRDIQAINMLLAKCLPVPGDQPTAPNPKDYPEDTQGKAKYQEHLNKLKKQQEDHVKLTATTKKELDEYFGKKDGEKYGRFISPYWQLDLGVRPNRSATARAGEHTFRGRITNVSGRRQNISKITFNVYFQDPAKNPNAQPAVLDIQHEYLAAGDTYVIPDTSVTLTARDLTIRGVVQKLEQKFAPVKRVDLLMLGKVSHRYAGQQLLVHKLSEPKEGEAVPVAPNMPTGGIPAPGGRDEGIGGPFGGPGGRAMNVSANGIDRQRYLHKTEQVRRMPIAVLLIVDQAHVQDVERAFANSRLRFQNTQFHWQRFRGTLSDPSLVAQGGGFAPGGPNITPLPGGGGGRNIPGGGSDDAAGGGGAPRGGGFARGPGPRGDFPPMRGDPGRPAGNLPPGVPFGGDQTVPVEEGTANLVELSVYGIASIYERYPPRPTPDAAAAGTTATDAGAPPPVAPPPAGTAPPAAGTNPPAAPTAPPPVDPKP